MRKIYRASLKKKSLIFKNDFVRLLINSILLNKRLFNLNFFFTYNKGFLFFNRNNMVSLSFIRSFPCFGKFSVDLFFSYYFDFLKRVSISNSLNSCILTGRGKGIIRFFKVSRFCFRKIASFGLIFGLRKSVW